MVVPSPSQPAETPRRAKVALSSVILAMMLVGVLVAALRVASQTVSQEALASAAVLGGVVGALAAVFWPGVESTGGWVHGLARFGLGALMGGPAGGLAVAPHAVATLLAGGALMVLFALVARRLSARPARSTG